MGSIDIEYTNDRYSTYDIRSTLQQVNLNGCDDEEVEFMWNLDHRHYLPCVFPLQGNNEVVYDAFTQDLATYVRDLGMSPIMFLEDCDHAIYVPDEFRRLFRSMVRFISYVHLKGFCTSQIREDNLVIHEDTLKFYKLTFCKSTIEKRYENLENIARIIEKIMEPALESNGLCFDNIQYMIHFLDCLRDATSDELVKRLADHVAVISFVEICSFIVESREKGRKRFELAYYKLLHRHFPISKSLETIKGGRSKWAEFVRLGNYASRGRYHHETNEQIFRCARNAVNHLRSRRITLTNIGIVIMDCFGLMMALFQQEMAARGHFTENGETVHMLPSLIYIYKG